MLAGALHCGRAAKIESGAVWAGAGQKNLRMTSALPEQMKCSV